MGELQTAREIVSEVVSVARKRGEVISKRTERALIQAINAYLMRMKGS